jgi:hypothetical protein
VVPRWLLSARPGYRRTRRLFGWSCSFLAIRRRTRIVSGGWTPVRRARARRARHLRPTRPGARIQARRRAWPGPDARLIARGFQALFNQPEAGLALLLETRLTVPYWRQVLEYTIGGNIQSLLDEQCHLEADGLALLGGRISTRSNRSASGACNADLRPAMPVVAVRRGDLVPATPPRKRRLPAVGVFHDRGTVRLIRGSAIR